MTPIGLVNNGVHVNAANMGPSIFASAPVQVLRLPRTAADGQPASPPRAPQRVLPAMQPPPGPTAPSTHQLLFGGNQGERSWAETTMTEHSRLSVVTMRQLQRALQQKITQSTRTPRGFWQVFQKLDRRNTQHLNLQDLTAAVRGYNLLCSDELIRQLLLALDHDHDGELSLTEFMGLQSDDRNTLQLQPQPHYGVSSRRHFQKSLKFHHPLHNLAHLSTFHQFEENPQY